MKNIQLGEKEVNVLEHWNEISLGKYIELLNLYQDKENMLDEMFLIKFITIISSLNENDVMNLYEDDLLQFNDYISNFNLNEFNKEENRIFDFNGIKYTVVIPNKLTIGENISIKLLEKSSKSVFDSWLNIITILVRPAIEKIDELGHIYYQPEPFNSDMESLGKRKELCKNIPAVNAMWILESFTTGRE